MPTDARGNKRNWRPMPRNENSLRRFQVRKLTHLSSRFGINCSVFFSIALTLAYQGRDALSCRLPRRSQQIEVANPKGDGYFVTCDPRGIAVAALKAA